MQDLNDYNKKPRVFLGTEQNVNKPAGVLCPDCKTELSYKHSRVEFLENSSKTDVFCKQCNYKGYKF